MHILYDPHDEERLLGTASLSSFYFFFLAFIRSNDIASRELTVDVYNWELSLATLLPFRSKVYCFSTKNPIRIFIDLRHEIKFMEQHVPSQSFTVIKIICTHSIPGDISPRLPCRKRTLKLQDARRSTRQRLAHQISKILQIIPAIHPASGQRYSRRRFAIHIQ